jgi:hypothetical protein
MKTKTLISLLFIQLLHPIELLPQESLSIGGYLGGGVIGGNIVSKGSFSSSLFLEVDPGFFQDLSLRLSFLYHSDINSILPNSTKDYFPFIKGYGLKVITFQDIEYNYFVEEGLGFIALNDRTISTTDEWDYGVCFSPAVGMDLRNFEKQGFKLSFGTDFGLTFFNTLPSYFSLYLQAQYFFL